MSGDTTAIRDASLKLLARREHSRYELRQKLGRKNFNDADIAVVLDELAERGWQSDTRYAENHARHRIQQGYGPLAIAYELKQHGAEVDNLDGMAEALAGGWMALLIAVYRKKYPDAPSVSRAEWAKRCRFLLQRGFPADLLAALPKQLPIKLS